MPPHQRRECLLVARVHKPAQQVSIGQIDPIRAGGGSHQLIDDVPGCNSHACLLGPRSAPPYATMSAGRAEASTAVAEMNEASRAAWAAGFPAGVPTAHAARLANIG